MSSGGATFDPGKQTTTEPLPATQPPGLSVVIPVFNERDNLETLWHRLQSTINAPPLADYRPVEVLWVEDESTDGTGEWIDRLANLQTHVHAVHLRKSWGQSAALAAGFDHAEGDIVVSMDGDLQNDPRDIPALLERIEAGADCVSGWRQDRDDPWHKTIPSAIQTHLATLTGPSIHDFGCTLTAYRDEALDDIDLRGETHRYLPAQLHHRGWAIDEVAVTHHPRENGESRYGVGRLVRGFVDLVFHWFWVNYSTRPMHMFGGIGLLSLGVGGLIGAVSVIQRFAFGVALTPKVPRLMLTVALVLFGAQLLIFGILGELLTKVVYDGDTEYRIEEVVG